MCPIRVFGGLIFVTIYACFDGNHGNYVNDVKLFSKCLQYPKDNTTRRQNLFWKGLWTSFQMDSMNDLLPELYFVS